MATDFVTLKAEYEAARRAFDSEERGKAVAGIRKTPDKTVDAQAVAALIPGVVVTTDHLGNLANAEHCLQFVDEKVIPILALYGEDGHTKLQKAVKTWRVVGPVTIPEIKPKAGRRVEPYKQTAKVKLRELRLELKQHHDKVFGLLGELGQAMQEAQLSKWGSLEGPRQPLRFEGGFASAENSRFPPSVYESMNSVGKDGSIVRSGESTLPDFLQGVNGSYRKVDSVVFQVDDFKDGAEEGTAASESLLVTLVPLTDNLNDHHSTIQYGKDGDFQTVSLYLPTDESLSNYRRKVYSAIEASLRGFPKSLKSALSEVLRDNIRSLEETSLQESHRWILTEMEEARAALNR